MLQSTDRITVARIEPSGDVLNGGDYQATVYVKVEGSDEEHVLFRYFDDELTFTTSEFVGTTVDEAMELRVRRDIAYLQS